MIELKNYLEKIYFQKAKNHLLIFMKFKSGMYGSRLYIGGIPITPNDFPECIQTGFALHKSRCYICEFFAEVDCPLRNDPTILLETKELFAQRKRYMLVYYERQQAILENRQALVEAIYDELKSHGRPLHYEILTKMVPIGIQN